MSHKPLAFIAHRGYAGHFPENSLAAIRAALRAGASYIEVDVQLSRDRVPVLFHDCDLRRLCGRSGGVHEYTAEALTGLSLRQPEISSQEQGGEVQIARLDSLVDILTTYPQLHLFVELKTISIERFGTATVAEKVIELLAPLLNRCTLISYSHEVLHEAQARHWGSVGWINDDWHKLRQLQSELQGYAYLFCDLNSLPPTGELGFGTAQLAVYECSNFGQALALAERGVDLIETFFIAEMLELQKEQQVKWIKK